MVKQNIQIHVHVLTVNTKIPTPDECGGLNLPTRPMRDLGKVLSPSVEVMRLEEGSWTRWALGDFSEEQVNQMHNDALRAGFFTAFYELHEHGKRALMVRGI